MGNSSLTIKTKNDAFFPNHLTLVIQSKQELDDTLSKKDVLFQK